jgi:acylphosphatase
VLAIKVIYKGMVQGVGFRYRSQEISSGFKVAGYVKNLADGSVELVVEGEGHVIESFLSQVAKEMAFNISSSLEQAMPHEGYHDFSIQR